ncbi:putative sinapoylglucose--sinapoylglucose O-sinapoyltransferase [Arabidopsis thaliana]
MKLTLKLLLLILLILNQHVDSASIVKFLPGFEGPLPFELETGYIGIGEEEEVQLFYYFIKSENNPKEDPLLLWLTGGPICSSITGLLFENGKSIFIALAITIIFNYLLKVGWVYFLGPLALKSDIYNGSVPSLVSTTHSWTQTANVIFLDQPVEAGFSYSRTPLIDTPSDTSEVKNIHEFLQKVK